MKKIVYFNNRLYFSTCNGADKHSREILVALNALGYELHLFLVLSDYSVDQQNELPFIKSIETMNGLKDRVEIKKRLSSMIEKIEPDLIFMNYPSWDNVLDHERFKNIKKVIHNHHFESIRQKMAKYYIDRWNEIVPTRLEDVHPDLYRRDFFSERNFQPDTEEYLVYDRYDQTYALCDFGEACIRARTHYTQVIGMPICLTPRETEPKYQKLALYPVSPFSYNYQGYCYFTKKILPEILKMDPLFRVRLTGFGANTFFSAPNIICSNYQSSLKTYYEQASLTLCPAFSGTGQQVKIIESMHHAVPVVMMENPMQFNPIEHEKTGFVAKNSKEFAMYARILYHDKELANEMGQRAQRVARTLYSNQQLIKILSNINRLWEEVEYV